MRGGQLENTSVTLKKGLVDELGHRMLEEPHWVARAKAAERLSALFCGGTLCTEEGRQAEEFFRLACLDGEVLVRRVLAESLKRSEQLSRKTALLFAADRPDVAAPLIEHSPILCEDDLLRILREETHAHRLAVARRFELGEPISEPMLATGNLELITTVLSNPGAAVCENTLLRLIASASLRPQIAAALARRRAQLPPRIAALLLEMFASLAPGLARGPPRGIRPGRRSRNKGTLSCAPFWRAPGELAFTALVAPLGRR